ncbi:peptidoglycan DD-metalloendopeptidase family protein [Rappaport israeli]|uniref:peptidoglycan DD-metalloendopeptidase family protein n=1 Tax=Rappaport israeli TaxID=1839807 RepID=UPI000931B33C|nr:peptidoglycan DD-metalloendopeptidase family protein [Rappaport israeli]
MPKQSKTTSLSAWLLGLSAVVLLSACSSGRQFFGNENELTAEQLHGARGALTPSDYYLIKKGDTLFGIAWRYGLDMHELASWNNLSNPDYILAGHQLRMKPPVGVRRIPVVAPQVTTTGQAGWIWPTRGQVISGYSTQTPGHRNLRIAGQRGQTVMAVNDGTVVYTGTGISGYGRMVIISHSHKVLSAYGYLDNATVREGQRVKRGQVIGTMGVNSRNQPALHFETRKQGTPVNPYGYIGTNPRF